MIKFRYRSREGNIVGRLTSIAIASILFTTIKRDLFFPLDAKLEFISFLRLESNLLSLQKHKYLINFCRNVRFIVY